MLINKEKKEALISIIIPVYNVEKYIHETIVSICNQDYNSIELILIDDESADDSIPIAIKVIEEYGINYRLLRQKNTGLPGARNAGIKSAKGDYVCFIDSDDIISVSHISDLVGILTGHKIDIAFSMFEYADEKHRYGKTKKELPVKILGREEFLYNFLRRKPSVHCCSLLIKRSILIDNGLLFNESLRRYGEDIEFMWRLFPYFKQIGCTGKFTYKYLVRDNSLMTIGKKEPWEIFIKEFARVMQEEGKKNPELKRYYLWAYYRTMLGLLRIVAESADYKIYREIAGRVATTEMIRSLMAFPDLKVKLTTMIMRISHRMYYMLYRRRIRL